MPTIDVLAVSPGLPVDDLLAHAEGGPQAAIRAAATLLPGRSFVHAGSGTWASPEEPTPEAVLVSTFGATTVLLGAPYGRLEVPPGMGTFSLSYQTVSMAYGVDVSGPRFQRIVALSPGVFDYAEGPPLPFEAAFADGVVEASATFSFDDEGFAAAAAAWMFGCHPLDPSPEDRVDLHRQPIHALVAAPTPETVIPPTARSRRAARRGLFRRA